MIKIIMIIFALFLATTPARAATDSKTNLSSDSPFDSFVAEDPVSLSQQVLPKGVWHPRLVFGVISEVSQLFDSRSNLFSVSRYNMTLNSQYLKEMSPSIKELIDNLNAFHPGNLGDKLNLGSLKFHGGPEISYFGLALAYGLTDRWTLGAALPFIHMYGGITIESLGQNNISDIESQLLKNTGDNPYSERIIPEIQNLPDDPKTVFNQKVLKERNFKSLEQIDYKGIGDLQIFSIYNYLNKYPWRFYLTTTLNLPTGPKDDPDSFIDFPEFAQTKILLKTHHEFQASNRLLLGSSLSYSWKMSDRLVKRVPKSTLDIIPEESRKEFLYRNLGDEVSIEAFGKFQATKFLSFDISASLSLAATDQYLGERPEYDYSILEDNTDKYWINGKLGIHFSSIPWFKSGRFPLPFIVSYNYSDILYGQNKPREVRHEASLLLFF